MNEQNTSNNEVVEIDVRRLLDAVLHKSWLVFLVAILCAAIVFSATFFFVTPKYESVAMFYVNNSSISVGDASLSISSSDITASKSLVDTYMVILNTRETLNDVIDYAGVNRTYSEVRKMIESEAVNGTEIFQIVVTSEDPIEAERIASSIAYNLPKRISSIVEGTSAKIVDSAIVATKPSSPNYTTSTMLGFVLGFVACVAIIVLREIFDISIRTEEDISLCCNHPVLAAVPDMSAPSKGGYYGYGENKKKTTIKSTATPQLVGDQISFAASEAYKLLRTKILYSFAGDKNCRVLGVSSALTGEGKSLTSVNLAFALSQLNNKVLLIDCDMRRPSIQTKLYIQKQPGLSGFLSGQTQEQSVFQFCNIPNNEQAFHVIASGQNPPNPVELLSSERMKGMLSQLREIYDYIILDLPPISEVSDAMAVAKFTDGMLLVVRQNHCNRIVLSDTIRQLEFIGAKILGTVYNCAVESSGAYNKKYYKKYYSKYQSAAKRENSGNS